MFIQRNWYKCMHIYMSIYFSIFFQVYVRMYNDFSLFQKTHASPQKSKSNYLISRRMQIVSVYKYACIHHSDEPQIV